MNDRQSEQRTVQRRSRADLAWKLVGVAALALSVWLLSRELRRMSLEDVGASLAALPATAWIAGAAAAVAAYLLLGAYERLALAHIHRQVDPIFVHVWAAATYAFAHVVGASVISGAVIRYRAYSSKGLSTAEIAALIAFCSVTFALGTIFVLGAVLVAQPFIVDRFIDTLPLNLTSGTGKAMIGVVVLYVACAALPLGKLRIGRIMSVYPSLGIAGMQVLLASLEIVMAALILYMALPNSPGFVTVTGVFIFSFAFALLSHSPGGLGVFELAVLTGLHELPEAEVLAALLVFRLYYFIVPFVFSVGAISCFEIARRKA